MPLRSRRWSCARRAPRLVTRRKAETRNAFAGSFSPDGKKIVFRLEQGDKYALAVIDRNGENMRFITKLSATKPRFIGWGPHP